MSRSAKSAKSSTVAIRAGKVVTPNEVLTDTLVVAEGGKITSVAPFKAAAVPKGIELVDASKLTLTPGLIDVQVNGALGHSFGSSDAKHLDTVLDYYLASGTTALFGTLVTNAVDYLESSLGLLAARCGQKNLAGIHLEGPFLNKERSGAHPQEYIIKPDLAIAERFLKASGGHLKIVTVAPEIAGAHPLIEKFAGAGAVVSAGHCYAKHADLVAAIDHGLSFMTHLGNASDWPYRAMNRYGFLGSEPGHVGTFLVEPRLRGSIIIDGFHIEPILLRAMVWARGVKNVCLISDASMAAGCPPGKYESGGMFCTIHPEGYATSNLGGGWLAGSVVTLARVVQVAMQRCGLPLTDIIRMATLTPAEVGGLADHKGQVAAGYDADLVLFDDNFDVQGVWLGGKKVAREDRTGTQKVQENTRGTKKNTKGAKHKG